MDQGKEISRIAPCTYYFFWQFSVAYAFFMLREVENFVKNLQEGAILIYISSL